MTAGDGGRLRPLGWEPFEGRRSLLALPGLLGQSIGLLWRSAPLLVLATVGLLVVNAVSQAAILLVLHHVIALAIIGADTGAALSTLLPGLSLLTVLIAVAAASQLLQGAIRLTLIERASWYAYERVLDVATAAELAAFDSPQFHDRLTRAQNAGGRPMVITQSLLGVGGSLTTLVSLLLVLLALVPWLVPLLLVILVPLLLVQRAFSKQYYDFTVSFNESERRRYYLRSLLVGREPVKEVLAYGLAAHIRRLHQAIFERRLAALNQVVRRTVPRSLAGGFAAGLVLAGCLALLLGSVLTGRTTVATATVGALTVLQLSGVLTTLALSIGQLYESSLFLADYRAFCDLRPQRSASVDDGRSAPAPSGFQEIALHDVCFTYPESSQQVLHGVSLEIRRGEVVALVGENGSGKTTLAKLLSRLYVPTSGTIAWDGVDIATVDGEQLRRRVAVVFQDFGRYMFPVADNIAIGRMAMMEDRDSVVRAAEAAGADQFIRTLPAGYDTQVGKIFEGGIDLSVGQWQRIALARAYFRGAELVVLDEPTAALDARAEYQLFEAMGTVFAGRTVLLISHRFSTVRLADRIYVLHGGRVAESGDHHTLLAAGGRYAELYALQSASYTGS